MRLPAAARSTKPLAFPLSSGGCLRYLSQPESFDASKEQLVLTVRAPQRAALQKALDTALVREIAQSLRTDHGERLELTTEPDLTVAIRSALVRARSRGYERRGDVEAFIALAVLVSPIFDEYPPFSAILGGKHPTPVRRLLEVASEADWRSAHRWPPGWSA